MISKKTALYTCLVGDYDRLYKPVVLTENIDYICFSDKQFEVQGWNVLPIDDELKKMSCFQINRRYKMFPYKYLKNYDMTIYVDSNIRIVGDLESLIEDFQASGAALGLLKHPYSTGINEEIRLCLAKGKIKDSKMAELQLKAYEEDGYRDHCSITENNVILRAHNAPKLEETMEKWWEQVCTYVNRDQLSLPYVRWKTGISVKEYEWSTGFPNPYLRFYMHKGKTFKTRMISRLTAKQYDSCGARMMLNMWKRISGTFKGSQQEDEKNKK